MRAVGIASIALAAFVLGTLFGSPIARAVVARAAQACSGKAACAIFTNNGSGPGVQSSSAHGNGLVGQTSFRSTSSDYRAGLLGLDLADSGRFNAGIEGTSKNGYGAFGNSTGGVGVEGEVTAGDSTSVAIEAVNRGSGAGMSADAKNGPGIIVKTLAADSSAIVITAYRGAKLIAAKGDQNSAFNVDSTANVVTTGTLTTSGKCSTGCAGTRGVRETAVMAPAATIEDTGEAQLRFGVANVPLDPKFGNAIDGRRGYYVLLTPEGQTQGLYVASRRPNGFVVRENSDGRSNAGFTYRIVAHPLGRDDARLPFVNTDLAGHPLRP